MPEKKKEVKPADFIAQLRVTPDRDLPSTPDTDLTYTLVVKNVGQGKATDVTARLPIDANLYPAWSTFSDPKAWVEKIVTDTEQPYVEVRFPDFEPNSVVTSTLVFKTKIDNVPGSVIFTRATVKWNDDSSINRTTGSNAVRLNIVDGAAKDETKGNVQFFTLTPSKTKSGKYILFGDFFGPDEIVALLYTGKDGKSITLDGMRADATGSISYELDPARLPQ